MLLPLLLAAVPGDPQLAVPGDNHAHLLFHNDDWMTPGDDDGRTAATDLGLRWRRWSLGVDAAMLTDLQRERRSDTITAGLHYDLRPEISVGAGFEYASNLGGANTQNWFHHAFQDRHIDVSYEDASWRPLVFVDWRPEWTFDTNDSMQSQNKVGFLVSGATTYDRALVEINAMASMGNGNGWVTAVGGWRQSAGNDITKSGTFADDGFDGWFVGGELRFVYGLLQVRYYQSGVMMSTIGFVF